MPVKHKNDAYQQDTDEIFLDHPDRTAEHAGRLLGRPVCLAELSRIIDAATSVTDPDSFHPSAG